MNRSTVIMLVLVIGLAGFYVWSTKHKADEAEKEALAKRLFAKVEENQVDRLEVEAKEADKKLVFERHDGRWLFGQQLLSAAQLDQLANDLGQLSHEKVIIETPKPEDLAEFGLDQPSYRLKLHVEDGAEYDLVLGSRTPDGQNFYAQVGGSGPIYMVAGAFGQTLEQDIEALREKSPMPVIPAQVRKLKLVTPTNTLVIDGKKPETKDEKKDEDEPEPLVEFSLVEPIKAPADRQQVNDYIWALKSLSGGRFLGPDEKVKWDHPWLRVEATLEDNPRPFVMEIGPEVAVKPGMYYVRRLDPEEAMVVELGDKAAKLLHPEVHEFQERHLVDFEVENVEKVTGHLGDYKLEAKRTSGGWKVSEPAHSDNGAEVTDLLWKIKDLRWEESLPQTAELKEPVADLEFFDKSGKSLGHVRLGAFRDGSTQVDNGAKPVYNASGNPLEEWRGIVAPLYSKNETPAASPTAAATP
ncbi:MAG: DUF4340 domain-containing protein [Vulcanimicrobiota bacterium]